MVVQIAKNVSIGDGVSNSIIEIVRILAENGFENIVYAESVDSRLDVDIYHQMEAKEIVVDEEDIVIYHFSCGFDMNNYISDMFCRKIFFYHNVTPPEFFWGIDNLLYTNCIRGLYEAKQAKRKYQYCLTDSEFNKRDLIEMGWEPDDIMVLPVFSLSSYETKLKNPMIKEFDDDYLNIIFVGRIAPNKCQEDIIRITEYYQKHVNKKVRLFLIGGIASEKYLMKLLVLTKHLQVSNVYFESHVSENKLEMYYSIADVFISMSEHEGFGVPLLEAFERGVPVLAYASSAVSETMSGAGVLLEKKDPAIVCAEIQRLTSDQEYRNTIIEAERYRAKHFSDGNEEKLIQIINKIQKEPLPIISDDRKKTTYYIEIEKNQMTNQRTISLEEYVFLQRPFVLYGIGKIGKRFVEEYIIPNNLPILAICDNGGIIDKYADIRVLPHEKCVQTYNDALYVISIQSYFLPIVERLRADGIPMSRICLFESVRNRIIR